MFARSSLMAMARVRNASSSLPWYFSWIALTDWASILACAGSYTPQGRSQCAWTVRVGAKSFASIGSPFVGGAGRLRDENLPRRSRTPAGRFGRRDLRAGHLALAAVAALPGPGYGREHAADAGAGRRGGRDRSRSRPSWPSG